MLNVIMYSVYYVLYLQHNEVSNFHGNRTTRSSVCIRYATFFNSSRLLYANVTVYSVTC